MSTKKPYIIAGIPAYNEEKTIAKVVLLTKKYVDKVVVVDDGSTDFTQEIAKSVGAEVIIHKKNKGKGAAIKDIIEIAKKENAHILVLLDADGQHNPEDIPKLIKPILQNAADIVIGSRFVSKKEATKKSKIPMYRRIGLTLLSTLAKKMANIDVKDPFSGFRALNKLAYETITLTEEGYGIELEMLIKAKEKKLKVSEVITNILYDTGTRTSKKGPLSQSAEIISTLIRKTVFAHPLIYVGIPGIISLGISAILFLYLINMLTLSNYFSIFILSASLSFALVGITLIINAILIILINDVRKSKY